MLAATVHFVGVPRSSTARELVDASELLGDEREIDESPPARSSRRVEHFSHEPSCFFRVSHLEEETDAPREPRDTLLRIARALCEGHDLVDVVERTLDVVSSQPDDRPPKAHAALVIVRLSGFTGRDELLDLGKCLVPVSLAGEQPVSDVPREPAQARQPKSVSVGDRLVHEPTPAAQVAECPDRHGQIVERACDRGGTRRFRDRDGTLEVVEARDVAHVGSRRTDRDERLQLRLDESELVGHAEH